MRARVARGGGLETVDQLDWGEPLLADADTWWRQRRDLDVRSFAWLWQISLGVLIFVWLGIEVALRGLPGGYHLCTYGVASAVLVVVPAMAVEGHLLARDRRRGCFTAPFQRGLQVRAMGTRCFIPWGTGRVDVVERGWMRQVPHPRYFREPLRFALVTIIIKDEGLDMVRTKAGHAWRDGTPPGLVLYGRSPGNLAGR